MDFKQETVLVFHCSGESEDLSYVINLIMVFTQLYVWRTVGTFDWHHKSCSTAHHEHLNYLWELSMSKNGRCESKGGMQRKKRSGRSWTHLPPRAPKWVLLLFSTHLTPHEKSRSLPATFCWCSLAYVTWQELSELLYICLNFLGLPASLSILHIILVPNRKHTIKRCICQDHRKGLFLRC